MITETYINKKCIIRSFDAGVFFGKVKEVSTDANGINVRLVNARKVWSWEGAAAVEQLSQDGCDYKSRLTITVPDVIVANASQILPCSDKAIGVLESLPEWRQ